MANVAISALPTVTTPLVGTEVLPIVQSSVTKRVTIADIITSFPTASSSVLGLVKVGSGLSIDGTGILSTSVPTASSSVLGLIKVGSGLSIDGTGILSAPTPSTLNNITLTGTLTAGGSAGTVNQLLVATGSGIQWSSSITLVNPTITNYTETRYSATVTGNAITLNLTNGTFQTITTMAGANTVTLPAVSSGKSLTVQVLYASTPTALTFVAATGSLKYPAGTTPTPTLTNGKYDFYSFVSDGTNWYGVQTGVNF